MRKWFILICSALSLLAFATQARAQGDIKFETLTVRLWSEYDQPSMLAIYDFELTADTPLPASVKIRIPNDANITAVAFQQGNDLLNAEFAGPDQVDEKWQVVTLFVKERATYHLEYYQPLTRDGNNRSFGYQWLGEYPINNFRIEIQLPEDSAAVKSTPTLPFVPAQPFLRGGASLANLSAGEVYQLELRYRRFSEETSQPPSSSQVNSEAITQNTAGRVTLNNLPYVLGGVGAVLIIGAIYYFWRSNSIEQTSKHRSRARRNKDEGSQAYCHECGARASADDRFCRVCGTKLRSR